MPQRDEHVLAVRRREDFEPGSLRRVRGVCGKGYSVIAGRLRGQRDLVEQAFAFDARAWSADEARTQAASVGWQRPGLGARSCRAAQLFGAWAIEPVCLSNMARIVNGMKPAEIAAIARVAFDQDEDDEAEPSKAPRRKPYDVVDGIAKVNLAGPMTKYQHSLHAIFGGTSTLETRAALRAAASDEEVEAILLHVDSPGGQVAGTHDLSDEVWRIRQRGTQVYAYVEDMAASAALAVTSQADQVAVNRSGLIGSIGTVLVVEDSSRQAEQDGIRVHVVSTGPMKGVPTDGAPVTDEQLADLRRLVESLFEQFASDIQRGRGMARDRVAQLATGQMWIGDEAVQRGLADQVIALDDYLQEIRDELTRRRGRSTGRNRSRVAI